MGKTPTADGGTHARMGKNPSADGGTHERIVGGGLGA